MAVFVIRRLLISLFTLIASSFLVFVLVANSGDPLADLRTDSSPDRAMKIAHRIEAMHLDQSVPRRYLTWSGGALECLVPGRGCDLGQNKHDQGIADLLGQAMATTLRLVTVSLLLAILLGVAVGVVSSLRQYSGFDYSITFFAFLFFSLPVFWVAVLLKQYLAIDVNNWYENPRIGSISAAVLALVSGALWGAVLGGESRLRRWLIRGASALVTFGLLSYLSWANWFRYPALGPGLITVLAFGAAVGITVLVAGLGRRGVLYSCLATAAVGCVVQFFAIPWLRNPTWASWTNVLLLLLVAVLVAVVMGSVFGGLDRGPAIRAALLTAVATGGLMVTDILLRTVPSYADLVNGRVFATIGSETPNFDGTFWQRQLDVFTHLLLPTKDLPAGVIAAGAPAKVIRAIEFRQGS